jgi:hypothetical protein
VRLTSTGTSLLGTAPHIHTGAAIDPRRAEVVLIAQGMRPIVAQAVAHGELSSAVAQHLGRIVKLFQ